MPSRFGASPLKSEERPQKPNSLPIPRLCMTKHGSFVCIFNLSGLKEKGSVSAASPPANPLSSEQTY